MYPNRCIGMVSPQYVSSGVLQDDYSLRKPFPISDLVWFPLTSEVSVSIIAMTALVWVLFSFIPKIFYTYKAL